MNIRPCGYKRSDSVTVISSDGCPLNGFNAIGQPLRLLARSTVFLIFTKHRYYDTVPVKLHRRIPVNGPDINRFTVARFYSSTAAIGTWTNLERSNLSICDIVYVWTYAGAICRLRISNKRNISIIGTPNGVNVPHERRKKAVKLVPYACEARRRPVMAKIQQTRSDVMPTRV